MEKSSTIIIGLGHKARQGKDTVANIIYDTYKDKYNIVLYALADALKREVVGNEFELCLKHGIEYDTNPDMTDPICNSKHGKQSKLLQFWGSYRRAQDPFYWIRKLSDQILIDRPQIAIVKDIRYFNEALWVVANDGYTVKVTRLNYVDLTRDPSHPSETQLNNYGFNYEIAVKEGDFDDLRKSAIEVFDLIIANETFDGLTTEDFLISQELTNEAQT